MHDIVPIEALYLKREESVHYPRGTSYSINLRRIDEFFFGADQLRTSLCPRSAKPLSLSRFSQPSLVPIVGVSPSKPCFSS